MPQDELTDKQLKFIEEYLIDLNGTQAAIRAGYSETTARQIASDNLAKPYIQEAITVAMMELSERTRITQERVVNELALIAFADMRHYADIEEGGGVTLRSFDKMPIGASRVISKIKERRKIVSDAEGAGKEVVFDSQLEFGHHDKVRALELLGRHLGMFNDKLKLQGDPENPLQVKKSEPIDFTKLTTEETMEWIREHTHGKH